jgi:hypothetical protein
MQDKNLHICIGHGGEGGAAADNIDDDGGGDYDDDDDNSAFILSRKPHQVIQSSLLHFQPSWQQVVVRRHVLQGSQ